MRLILLRTIIGVWLVSLLVACGGESTPTTHRQVKEKACLNLINANRLTNRNQCGLAEEFELVAAFDEMFGRKVDRAYVETGMAGFPQNADVVLDCATATYRNCEDKNPTRLSYVVRERSSKNFTEIIFFTFENGELADIAFEKE